jgi:hypothetical protein
MENCYFICAVQAVSRPPASRTRHQKCAGLFVSPWNPFLHFRGNGLDSGQTEGRALEMDRQNVAHGHYPLILSLSGRSGRKISNEFSVI